MPSRLHVSYFKSKSRGLCTYIAVTFQEHHAVSTASSTASENPWAEFTSLSGSRKIAEHSYLEVGLVEGPMRAAPESSNDLYGINMGR